ncbi:MAG TPA: ABC transporter ATP-binding protein, partial [Microterricola sp.]
SATTTATTTTTSTSTTASVPVDDPMLASPLLRARGLSKAFRVPGGRLQAVDDVSLELHAGQTLGLVGESGSGKSTVARLLLGLSTADAGTVTLDGEPWSPLPEKARRTRRHRIGAIYQDSLGSFDPRWSVGRIVQDAIRGPETVTSLLGQVGLAAELAPRHPLTLSGGQRQRVSIARALAAEPELLICDEPVSALDVTVQAQILELLTRLQRERGLSMLFISHDLAVIRQLSDTVAVMRDGRIVESGATESVFAAPAHPFTRELLDAVPRLVG